MKPAALILLISIALVTTGCSWGPESSHDCTENMLDKFDMVKYQGEDPECRNFLELYTLFDKQFFALGNHCADMIFDPIDCDGKSLFRDGNIAEQNLFRNFSKSKGIIGISR